MRLTEYLATYEAAHRHPLNKLTHAIGIPTIVASLVVVFFKPWLGLAMFVAGWVLQFLGHHFEGNSPKFFQGPVYLLVGVVWVPWAIARAIAAPFRQRATK